MKTPTLIPILYLLISLTVSSQPQPDPQTPQPSTQPTPTPTPQLNISAQQDQYIQNLSQFFIDLITKYDETGRGLVKRERYPDFLYEVFMKGTFGGESSSEPTKEELEYQYKDLLREATGVFTDGKSEETKEISVQEFYEDIISKFTLFVMENQRYKVLVETLFENLEENTAAGVGKVQEGQVSTDSEEQGTGEGSEVEESQEL